MEMTDPRGQHDPITTDEAGVFDGSGPSSWHRPALLTYGVVDVATNGSNEIRRRDGFFNFS